MQTVFAADLPPKMTFILNRFGCIIILRCYDEKTKRFLKNEKEQKTTKIEFGKKTGGGGTSNKKSSPVSLIQIEIAFS